MRHPRSPLRTLVIGAAATAIVAVFVVFGLAGSSGPTGHAAPPLPHDRLSGPPATLAVLRGRSVVVTFWASWCEPCEREAPALERFSRGLGARATLVGVNWEDLSLANARAFVRRYGWTFSNLRDPDGIVGRGYGVTSFLPTTFVIDGSGRLRVTLHGPQTQQALTAALAAVGA